MTARTRYQLNAEHIAQHWSARSRAALVASPANPTGMLLTQAELPRSATVEELQAELKDIWPHCRSSAILSDALGLAKRLAGPDDLICVTGSLMLIGDLKGLVRGCGLSPLRG